jgi:hypothetical protein
MGGCSRPPVIEKPEEFMPAETISEYPVQGISWRQMCDELIEMGLESMESYSDRPDVTCYYTDEESLKAMLPYLTYDKKLFPEKERKDCDDYTIKSCADLRFYFGIMGLQIHGWYGKEYHAFCAARVPGGKWVFWEPNKSFNSSVKLFGMKNEFGYKPERWKS